jgi:hypothetical protein
MAGILLEIDVENYEKIALEETIYEAVTSKVEVATS